MLEALLFRLSAFGLVMASILIDMVFLSLWLFLQWVLGIHVIPRFQVTGFHLWFSYIFQVVFAVGTLLPLLIYIYVDLATAFVKGKQEIQKLAGERILINRETKQETQEPAGVNNNDS